MKRNMALKIARAKLGMTQRDLSEESGLSESLITKIETLRITPTSEQKKKLSDALKVPTFELFGNGGAK